MHSIYIPRKHLIKRPFHRERGVHAEERGIQREREKKELARVRVYMEGAAVDDVDDARHKKKLYTPRGKEGEGREKKEKK